MRRIFKLRNLLFLALAAGLVALILSQQSVLDRNIERNKALKDNIQAAQQKIEDLEAEKSILGSDEYVERKARENLGYVKSDETVFIKEE
ncbi:MAG: FtsB family cell division protein [Clostridia bacterium]